MDKPTSSTIQSNAFQLGMGSSMSNQTRQNNCPKIYAPKETQEVSLVNVLAFAPSLSGIGKMSPNFEVALGHVLPTTRSFVNSGRVSQSFWSNLSWYCLALMSRCLAIANHAKATSITDCENVSLPRLDFSLANSACYDCQKRGIYCQGCANNMVPWSKIKLPKRRICFCTHD